MTQVPVPPDFLKDRPLIDAATRLAGIIGWPVDHSQSPRVHGFWLAKFGINGAYVPLPVPPEEIEAALHGLLALGFRGANVTIPHKETVMALLDHVTPLARQIGAVNTLFVRSDGRLEGTNTDAQGFIDNLHATVPDWKADAAPAVVLGAGGASRAVCAALLTAGVPRLTILNRTPERARCLADTLAEYHAAEIRVLSLSETAWHRAAGEAGLAVNTTSLGMKGHPPLGFAMTELPPSAVVADTVYAPLRTPFIAAAEQCGLRTVDGLGMLLYQAGPGFTRWFGKKPQVTDELRAFVLAGMKG